MIHKPRSFLGVIVSNFDVLGGPMISLIYPLYATIKTIKTGCYVGVRKWLSYWIIHSMITLFELSFAEVLEWIPIWPYTKLIVTCYLVVPYFNILFNVLIGYFGNLLRWLVIGYFGGTAYVYEHFVKPFFVKHRSAVEFPVSKKNMTVPTLRIIYLTTIHRESTPYTVWSSSK